MRKGGIDVAVHLGIALLCFASNTGAYAGSFGTFRYDDDFSDLRRGSDAYAGIKHIPLDGERRYLSLGGELRERMEFYSNSNIGKRPVSNDSFFLHRLLAHADIHWDDARVFVQIGSHGENGRQPRPKPTDVDSLDIQQAFLDYTLLTDAGTLLLRVGRQEMAYGASRLISARDGPNIRLAFDGLRMQLKSAEWNVSFFDLKPVDIRAGRFDDRSSRSQSISGVYAVRNLSTLGEAATDLYYFRTLNDGASYANVSGNEQRNTFGMRLYGKSSGFDGDVELMLQSGRVANQEIRAFALATDTGWSWPNLAWRPRLGLRTDVISGDRHANDGRLGTFNALYPNGSYFSEANILAQANLVDYAVSVSVRPQANLSVALSYNPMWRYSKSDAVYSLPLSPMLPAQGSSARSVGTQVQLLLNWQYSSNLSFKGALVRFNAGEFVQQSGGQDLDYAQLSTTIRF